MKDNRCIQLCIICVLVMENIYSHFIGLAAKNQNKIQIRTEMYTKITKLTVCYVKVNN